MDSFFSRSNLLANTAIKMWERIRGKGKTKFVPRCHSPWQQMIVDAGGTVHPCSFWGTYGNVHQVKSFGNINDNTIDEIWNNSAYQHLRREHARGDLKAAGCANCYAVKQGLDLSFDYDPESENETGPKYSPFKENIEILKREIETGATILSAKPTIVSYTPSHKCNLRCIQCYQEGTRTAKLSRSTADHDLQRLAPYLVRIIAGGGEPFLLRTWRDFLRDFDIEKNPYLDFGVTTNGTLITDKVITGLERFKTLTINVSVDATGEVLEHVREGLSWPILVSNIEKLKKIVLAKGGRSNIGITACVQKSTILDLPNLIRFALKEEISFGLSPVITMPPDESLVSFNQHPKKEMEGWQNALTEARNIWLEYLAEKYFQDWDAYKQQHGLANISKVEATPEDVRASWTQIFDNVERVIKWDLAAIEHYHVEVKIDPISIQLFKTSPLQQSQWKGGQTIAYIFPKGQLQGNAPYWAPVNEEGMFSAWLPKGSYTVNLSTKWFNAAYSPMNEFEVHSES